MNNLEVKEKIKRKVWLPFRIGKEDELEAKKHFEEASQLYTEIQDIISSAESNTNRCYDTLADQYYEKYSDKIVEEEQAIKNNCVYADRVSIAEMLKDWKRLQDSFSS